MGIIVRFETQSLSSTKTCGLQFFGMKTLVSHFVCSFVFLGMCECIVCACIFMCLYISSCNNVFVYV